MGVYNSGGINPAVSAWLPARWSWGGFVHFTQHHCVIAWFHVVMSTLPAHTCGISAVHAPTHSCWAPGWIDPRRLGEVFAIWSAQRLGGKLRRWRRPLAKTDSEGWSIIYAFYIFFCVSVLYIDSIYKLHFSPSYQSFSMILTAFPWLALRDASISRALWKGFWKSSLL